MTLDLPSIASIVKGAEDDARTLRSIGWEPEEGDLGTAPLAPSFSDRLPAIFYFAQRRIQENPVPACLRRLYVYAFTRKWNDLAPKKDPTP